MRQQRYHLEPKLAEQILTALWSAADRSDTKYSTAHFLQSLLTETEQIQIGRRLLIAQHLLSGHSWSRIRADLHVSPNTIDLVQEWLKQQFPNYEGVTKARDERTLGSQKPRRRTTDPNPLSFANLRRKYPAHFLLWNLLVKDPD